LACDGCKVITAYESTSLYSATKAVERQGKDHVFAKKQTVSFSNENQEGQEHLISLVLVSRKTWLLLSKLLP